MGACRLHCLQRCCSAAKLDHLTNDHIMIATLHGVGSNAQLHPAQAVVLQVAGRWQAGGRKVAAAQ